MKLPKPIKKATPTPVPTRTSAPTQRQRNPDAKLTKAAAAAQAAPRRSAAATGASPTPPAAAAGPSAKASSDADADAGTGAEFDAEEAGIASGDDADNDPRADSSLARMLGALALFSTDTPALTVEQIAAGLGVPKSTGYRYVQELCKVGLLVRLDRSITLGPRIIELDRAIRESDPVIRAAAPPMRALSEQTGLDVFISKLYGRSIITVHMECNDGQQLPYGYGRGRPMPVMRGSSSKALVSNLPAARLRRLHQELLPDAGGAPSWEAFYDEAQRIRRQGWCRTSGELNEGKTGISAPVFGRGRVVVASITAVGNDARFTLFDAAAIAGLVTRTARTIGARLAEDTHL
ncbi:MAG: IclR family transcriptional regulator [Burkholderiales bacterium]